MTDLTIRLPKYDDMVGGAEEVQALEQMRTYFAGRNLYLNNFFRPDLIDWAISCIQNDVAPDIWADRMYHITCMNEAQARVHSLRAEIETLKDEANTSDENTEAILIERDEKIVGLKDHIETLEHINDSLRNDLRMARERIGEQARETVRNKTSVSSLQLEVIELKAKLWDLVPTRE